MFPIAHMLHLKDWGCFISRVTFQDLKFCCNESEWSYGSCNVKTF